MPLCNDNDNTIRTVMQYCFSGIQCVDYSPPATIAEDRKKFELLLSAGTTSSGQCIVESVADEGQPPAKSKCPSHLSKRPDPVPELTDNERPYLKGKRRVSDSVNETEEEE